MAKGAIAKQAIMDKIVKALGDDFVAVVDGKAYAWAKENGENLQIAISLTYKKDPIGAPATTADLDFGGGLDFESMGTGEALAAKQTEITEEEKRNIEELFAKLGL